MGFNSAFKRLNYNWDCAYANEFTLAVADPGMGKMRTTARVVTNLKRGHNFGWKAED